LCNEEEWSAVSASVFTGGLFAEFCKTVSSDENTGLTRVVNVKGEEVPKTRKQRRQLRRQLRRAPQDDSNLQDEVLNSYEFELIWSPGPEGNLRDCETIFKAMASSQCGKLDSSGDKMAFAAELDTGSGKYSYKVTKGDKFPTPEPKPEPEPEPKPEPEPEPTDPEKDCEDKCLHRVPIDSIDDIINCDCRKYQPEDPPPAEASCRVSNQGFGGGTFEISGKNWPNRDSLKEKLEQQMGSDGFEYNTSGDQGESFVAHVNSGDNPQDVLNKLQGIIKDLSGGLDVTCG
jgi:hypothetical protein